MSSGCSGHPLLSIARANRLRATTVDAYPTLLIQRDGILRAADAGVSLPGYIPQPHKEHRQCPATSHRLALAVAAGFLVVASVEVRAPHAGAADITG
jgi:hypothetical protein